LRTEFPDLHLLIVGPFEGEDPLPSDVITILKTDDRIHLTGGVPDTVSMYAAMDLLVLPTYREGFPNVLLEAAAMGLPVVATRVPGCVDAVADEETGRLVPAADAQALAEGIRAYVKDSELRRLHGTAGRERVLKSFRQRVIWEALYQEYRSILKQSGMPLPMERGAEES
ncbi:MAG TPA: glycosyltransferase, partial [Symbiobacteriaceae bacterium]|nr:glycosyltransferase [Symbiobacteriaceae bacterium]